MTKLLSKHAGKNKVCYLDLPILDLSKDGIYQYEDDPDGFCWAPDHDIVIVINNQIVYQKTLYSGKDPKKIGMVNLKVLKQLIEEEIETLTEAISVINGVI